MISVRKYDEERIMQAIKKAGEADPGSRATITISLLADLICDVRHETIKTCFEEVSRTLTLVTNKAMTSERFSRLLNGSIKEPE